MRTAILTLFFLVTLTSYGQKNQIKVSVGQKPLGINLVDSSVIAGTEYLFPERIHETYLDSISGFLTAQLRGVSKNGKWLDNTGHIVQFDFSKNQVLWSKKMAYQNDYLQQFSNSMILNKGNKSYFIDNNTGEDLWEVKNNLYYVDHIDKIGIGYKYKVMTGYSNELEGIDLINGKVIWNRDINREFGWNNVFYINDSTIIIVAAGLHSVNINTGRGWDYNTVTGKKDYTETIAKNAIGAVAGVLTGSLMVSSGHNLVRELLSNILLDSVNIYLASKEQLAAVDKFSGKVVWKTPFPEDLASSSSIHMDDSTIYVINKGMAYMGDRQLNFGKPFFAGYNRQTGQQKFFSLIDIKKDPILGFHKKKDEIYFIFKNRMMSLSLENGGNINAKEFPEDSIGELKYFAGKQVYTITPEGYFEGLTQSDTSKVYIVTSQDKILALDHKFNITQIHDIDDISVYYEQTPDYKFFAKGKTTSVVNNEGKKVAEVEATSNAFIFNENLYDIQNERFIKLDLREIKAIPQLYKIHY